MPAHPAISVTFNVEATKMSAQLAAMSNPVANRNRFEDDVLELGEWVAWFLEDEALGVWP